MACREAPGRRRLLLLGEDLGQREDVQGVLLGHLGGGPHEADGRPRQGVDKVPKRPQDPQPKTPLVVDHARSAYKRDSHADCDGQHHAAGDPGSRLPYVGHPGAEDGGHVPLDPGHVAGAEDGPRMPSCGLFITALLALAAATTFHPIQAWMKRWCSFLCATE